MTTHTYPITTQSKLKRVAVAVTGWTVLVIGIVMLVLPGPAFVVIPGGLAILAIEFAWARRWLRSVRAVTPRFSKSGLPLREKWTLKSVWRSVKFLFRQVCQ